jgi:hypothetical protein
VATEADILSRVRKELGDLSEPFRQSFRGTGTQDEFDLPVARVSTTGLNVYTVDPTTTDTVTLVLDTDFTVDTENGIIRLTSPLAQDVLLIAEGTAFGMFTDDELEQYVRDAIIQHTHGQNETTRFRDGNGFIRYDRVAKTIDNLPEVEELPVSLLASVNALWALITDAATDVDITTSEGTHIPRSQRFAQLQNAVHLVTQRYQDICAQLNVGLYKIEVMNLRRVSRTTNRLIPIFVEREYDETTLPTRITPEIDTRDADPDGPPSPAYMQGIF